MSVTLKDYLLNTNKLIDSDKIILPECLIDAIAECRFNSELQGIEIGFNIYLVNQEITIGNMQFGEKTNIILAPRDGEPSNNATWLGSCHAHPYMWKLSKRAAVGPSSGDVEGYARDFKQLTYRRGVHFVISNWRLYMLTYFKKTDPFSINIIDYTPMNALVNYADDALRRKRQESFEAYKSQFFLFKKKPKFMKASDRDIEDIAYGYYEEYASKLYPRMGDDDPEAYLDERELNKCYKIRCRYIK